MPKHLKSHPFIGIAFLVGVPLLTIYMISLVCAKSGFFTNFPMLIQDCEMTVATLKGRVVDKEGNPIPNAEVYFENSPVDNSTPVKQTVSNNKSGHFGPTSIHFFKCEFVTFTIRATGFHEQTVTYAFELLPRDLIITLERSS